MGGGTQLEKGPCVNDYREAFTCFIMNKDDDVQQCYEKFVTWQACMAEHPDDYSQILKDMNEGEDDLNGQTKEDEQKPDGKKEES